MSLNKHSHNFKQAVIVKIPHFYNFMSELVSFITFINFLGHPCKIKLQTCTVCLFDISAIQIKTKTINASKLLTCFQVLLNFRIKRNHHSQT